MRAIRWPLILSCVVAVAGCTGPKRGASTFAPSTPAELTAAAPPAAAGPPTQAELAAAGPFQRTSSGLKYRVLRTGAGGKPRSTDTVRAHYHGWLNDGTVFDSSFQRGSPTSFSLQQVVPGWTEGLQYIGEGGRIELEIPSNLGYGSKSPSRKIPPNSTLHFVVELLAIEN